MSTLDDEGWLRVEGIDTPNSLLDLARSLGEPIPSPTGEICKTLRPLPPQMARPGTFSHRYGTGSFPLHTDTAFWPTPARYLVMRVTGDTRRPTLVAPIEELFRQRDSDFGRAIVASVWIARSPRPFYCSMLFRSHRDHGIRYDSQALIAGNSAAWLVSRELPALLNTSDVVEVDWSIGGALVLANWRVLHGRGPEPENEGDRFLDRIYVR